MSLLRIEGCDGRAWTLKQPKNDVLTFSFLCRAFATAHRQVGVLNVAASEHFSPPRPCRGGPSRPAASISCLGPAGAVAGALGVYLSETGSIELRYLGGWCYMIAGLARLLAGGQFRLFRALGDDSKRAPTWGEPQPYPHSPEYQPTITGTESDNQLWPHSPFSYQTASYKHNMLMIEALHTPQN